MSRLILPEDFYREQKLVSDIKDKHDADGASSVLTPFLTQHGIVLADDEAAMDTAKEHEENRLKFAGQAEKHRAKRDLLFHPVLKHCKKYYQFLKSFYKPEIAEVGEWGVNITVNGRIVYPVDFSLQVTMFTALKTKHETFPVGTSPLDPYLTKHGLTIADDYAAVQLAVAEHVLMTNLSGQSEDEREDRDNLVNPVMEHVRGIGGFLKALHSDSTQDLIDWGFVVDQSPRAPKVVKSKVLLLSQITINGVIIGGTLKNTGTVAIHLFKGNTATGTPVIVPAGEMYGIEKGFSIITAYNPSPLVTATFTALRSR